MREIKFRAWINVDKQIRPVIGIFYNPDTMELMDVNVGESEKIDWRNQSDVVLMQYTGLKDGNGKEIYEGDILEDIEGTTGVVVWNGIAFTAVDIFGWDNLQYPDESIVIGNIYENPNLLKDGK